MMVECSRTVCLSSYRRTEDTLPALWAFLQSDRFREAARSLDQKLAIARSVFDAVPFDLNHWQGSGGATVPRRIT